MSKATKRLFIGGLSSSITEDEIESRFEKFGDVSEVNLVKKDSVNGNQEHCFAHFTYKGDEKQLKKLMTTFNNTRWKGRTVRIEPAKEDFLDRLAQEKKAKLTVNEKKQPPKREDTLMENFKKAGVEDFVKKKAVPGTAIEGEKNWVVGKYGRVLPVVYLRRRDKRKITKFDPSKYSHHLKQIKGEDDMHGSKISSITWQMENSSSHPQKRQLHPKQKKSPEKNKNMKHRSSPNDSGYMFNFFGNEKEDDEGDQVDDTSCEVGAMNEEDSDSDSDTTDDSGPSVPNLKRRKTSDGRREQSVKRDTNTSQDSLQPVSSEGRQKDPVSDSADIDEICASKQRQCKEGKLSSKEVKHKVPQEHEYSSLQAYSSERTKVTVVKEKPVNSGKLEVDDKVNVNNHENVLTDSGISGQKSSRDGSRHDARSAYNDRRNSNEDHADDSSINDSDDDTSGSDDDGSGEGKGETESGAESADTDEICMKRRQSQVKVKTEKSLNSIELEVEDENAEKDQENLLTGDGINGRKSSGSGSRHGTRSEIINMSKSVEANVDDVGMSCNDTSGSDDDGSSDEKKETESDNESADVDEIGNRKQKQRKADAKGKYLRNNGISEVMIQSTKSHRGSKVGEGDAAVSVNSEKRNQFLVKKSGRESDDSSSDSDGSSLSSAPSLKRKRESNEGSSDTDRVADSEKGRERMKEFGIEQQSHKKLRRKEQTSIGKEGGSGLLSLQGNLPGTNFELLVLDRDILIKQGYNTAEHEGEEENSLEDELELSESVEDSDSDGSEKEEGKGKKKNKLVMPEFKGMNSFRKHFRDGEGNDCKENQMSKRQDLSTDEFNAWSSMNELVTVKKGLSPSRNGATSLKKRKRRKDNNLDSGNSADTLETDTATQLKMRMGKVSRDESDEDDKEQVDEERSKDEMLGMERQEGKGTFFGEQEDRKQGVSRERLPKELLEDSGRGRDADDESSDLDNFVDGDTGRSSKKRKKKKKLKEKLKEEENEKPIETGKNATAFSDSLSLINAVQQKYSKEVELPEHKSAGDEEEEIDEEETKDGLERSELESERSLKGESFINSSGGESLEDTGKNFANRMTEFGQKYVEKRKLSEGGRKHKEVTVTKTSSEKLQTGTNESKKEKTKTDISKQDTADISNQRRLQAIKERREELKNKQKAIQTALAKVDEPEKPDAKKHMRFDSESEEDPEVAEEAEREMKSTSKEPSLSLFTGENNEESGSDEDWFQVKPQFEGEKGLQLLKLQQRFGDDERFKLDERFAEDEEDDDEGGGDTKEKNEEDWEDGDLETEKTKALSILENVLGSMLPAQKNKEDKKAKFRDIGQVRFDPSREDHEKFLLPQQEVSETTSKSKKKRKKKKKTEEVKGIVEAPLPEVSKEVFFDVKSDLTSALTQSQPVMFGFFNDNEDEETHENKEEEYFPPPSDFVWEKKKLPYDSSDSDGEADEAETTKQEALSVANPKEMEQQSRKSFFFGRNDYRLKDGASQFCRSKDSSFKDNWEEKRTKLWAATYKRHQKALRDNKQNRKQRRPFKHH